MILEVKNLKIKFKDSLNYVVNDVSFKLNEGEIVSLVGESGSGKSVTSLAIMGLLSEESEVSGEVIFNNKNLLNLNEKEMCKIRGKDIGMIFQEPMSALNPLMTVENQIGEVITQHTKLEKKAVKERVIELLEKVKIPNPKGMLKKYPHELSGGMRQRVMIAMAIAMSPKILIADEPTTALDVTIQNEILELLKDIAKEMKMSIIFITHDLDVVCEMANRVLVMYLGNVVEEAPILEFFDNTMHPYSKGLILSRPSNILEGNRLYSIKGMVPSVDEIPNGCSFSNRCSECLKECTKDIPKLKEIKANHKVRCHLY